MICDCCLREFDRFWVYRHRGFGFKASVGNIDFNAGWWAFCIFCHTLFLEHDFYALSARVVVLNQLLDPTEIYEHYRVLSNVIYGEAVFWQEGEDWSAKRFPLPTYEEQQA
jgi:hypothetical protein